ncbi:MAG: hypothetical protein ABT940_05480 [Alphaproteobacteria bacterium]
MFKKGHKPIKSETRVDTKRENKIRASNGDFIALRYARAEAIKLMCTECLGWEVHPKDCTAPTCPLFPFRGVTRKSYKGAWDNKKYKSSKNKEKGE